jgi:hypothetical protein
MKARIDPYSKLTSAECKILADQMNDKMDKGIIKVQYLMLIAMNREFNIGPKRTEKLMNTYKEVVAEFEEYTKDGEGETKLLQSIQQILPKIKRLYD